MKAITVKQPWASLIVSGIKDIENRTWKTYFRGRVLIHSSSGKSQFNFTTAQNVKLNELNLRRWYDREQIKGSIIGSVEIVDCTTEHPSIWAKKNSGRLSAPKQWLDKPTYNWVLANPIKFPEPIPVKGKLMFWDYPNILAEPEGKDGELFCHCQLPVKQESQVFGDGLIGYYCRYCGGKWYK